jgi:hypothetical protein
MLIEHRPSHLN